MKISTRLLFLLGTLGVMDLACKPMGPRDFRQQLATAEQSSSLPAKFALDLETIEARIVPLGSVNNLFLAFTVSYNGSILSPANEEELLPLPNHYIEYEVCPRGAQDDSACQFGTSVNHSGSTPAPTKLVTIMARMAYEEMAPRRYDSKAWKSVDFEVPELINPETPQEGEELYTRLRQQQTLGNQIARDSKTLLSKLDEFFSVFKECRGGKVDANFEERQKAVSNMSWEDLSDYFLTEELPRLLDWKPDETPEKQEPEISTEKVEEKILDKLGVPEHQRRETIEAITAGVAAALALGLALLDVWSIALWQKYLKEQRTVTIEGADGNKVEAKLVHDKKSGLWRTPDSTRYYIHDPISKHRIVDDEGKDVFFKQNEVDQMGLRYNKRQLYLGWDYKQADGGQNKDFVARGIPKKAGNDLKFGDITVGKIGGTWELHRWSQNPAEQLRKLPYNEDQVALWRHTDDPSYDSSWFAKKLRGKLRVGKISWAVGKATFSIILMGVALKQIADMGLVDGSSPACKSEDTLRGDIQSIVTSILLARSRLEVVKKDILRYL